MQGLDSLLKLKHQLAQSIPKQQAGVYELSQIFMSIDEDVTIDEIQTMDGTIINLINDSYDYSFSSSETESGYSVHHEAGQSYFTVSRFQQNEQPVEVQLDLDLTSQEMRDTLSQHGIDADAMISSVKSGLDLNQTVTMINDQFLAKDKININTIHDQLYESQLLMTPDQREMFTQLASTSSDGTVHKITWMEYISKVLHGNKKQAEDETFALDESDPFTKSTFLNTMWNVLMGALGVIFAALAIIFKALYFVFNAVLNLISNLINMYQDYDNTVKVSDSNVTGRVTGPVIAIGYESPVDPLGIHVEPDGYMRRYNIPGLELLTWAKTENNIVYQYLNGYVNANVDPTKLRNYIFKNIKLRISDDPNDPSKPIGHIVPIKELFNQDDPEWVNVFDNDNYNDVGLSLDRQYAMSSDQMSTKILLGFALTCFFLNYAEHFQNTEIFDFETSVSNTYNHTADLSKVIIIDADGVITQLNNNTSLRGEFSISQIHYSQFSQDQYDDPFYPCMGYYDFNFFDSKGINKWAQYALAGIQGVVHLLRAWPVVHADGAHDEDLLTQTIDVPTHTGVLVTKHIYDLLTYKTPIETATALRQIRSEILTKYNENFVFVDIFNGDYYPINGDRFYHLTDSVLAYDFPLRHTVGNLGQDPFYIDDDMLLSPWNKLDEQIDGTQYSLPDPAVDALVKLVSIITVIVVASLIIIKVGKMKFTKFTRAKQVRSVKRLEALRNEAARTDVSEEQQKINIKTYNKAIFKYNLQAKLFGWGSYDAANNWVNTPDSGSVTSSVTANSDKISSLYNTSTESGEEAKVIDIARLIKRDF